MKGIIAVIVFSVALFAAFAPVSSQSIECTICEYVCQYAEQYISSNSTESEVEQLLDDACNDLGPVSTECTALVNQYLSEIVQYLITNQPPNVICSEINLCSSNTTDVIKGQK
eukprot:TRINITY_DN141297_c0_g1_i1.p2 TRINITY_DN141297_c0_g1~~TRINITY_DN141297_c0_g1_i1.p2  ORF type:complete len:120 (-),score=31.90 TRINITY_DN141297_c0_g1_i1:59-397(-)